ncbi:response regulator [Candidatus Ferrigenium straubiae]|jgi:DNA-binding NtrC family response regulator|uniref:response regulator n=1 Tax=Candidatus Ferrigenium straubiae TaxID=2919506 RepID=UPI003F4A961C
MYRILLVDDEQNVINALRRELQGGYAIEAFINPREALQHCRGARFDVAIVDYRMPEMNGVEFLRQFGALQPDAVRLMLSGQADFDALVGTVNEAHIYRFIDKPWDSPSLAATLAEALAHREQILENRRLAEQYRQQHHWQRPPNPDRLYQVLVVDDEANMLNAITHDLNARGGWSDLHTAMLYQADPTLPLERRDLRFNIFTTTSPIQALERAKQIDYDVVIADYLMPEMDGLRFLEAFRKIQPDAVRILLSGHADKDTLANAINRSEIYGYIGKPWREYLLKNTVSQAIFYHDLRRENRLLAARAGTT